MSTLTATELRRDVYRVLDRVLETGAPQEILRRGRRLMIMPSEPKRRRFEDAPKHEVLSCSFEELVATSWEQSWNPER